MGRHRLLLVVASLVVAGLIAAGGAVASAAQNASPAAVPGIAGFPVLRITSTDHGFTMPARVTAGRYLVVLDNKGKNPVGTSILRLPNGVSVLDVQNTFARMPAVPPIWYYSTLMPGAPDVALPGQQTQVILDLVVPGPYIVISSDPPAPPATTFEVVPATRATPGPAPTPQADADITETDFQFFHLPTSLSPGEHIWRVTNASSQPHMLDLSRVPAGTTLKQAIAALEAPAATPAGGMAGMNMSSFTPAGGLMLLSAGQTGWAVLNLPPGRYVAVCSVIDPATGKPHYLLGMIGLFDVGASGAAPAASPMATAG